MDVKWMERAPGRSRGEVLDGPFLFGVEKHGFVHMVFLERFVIDLGSGALGAHLVFQGPGFRPGSNVVQE